MWRGGTAAAVYAAAAVLITWPLVLDFGSRLGAPEGPGDPYLNLWVLGWGIHSWQSDPLGTLAGRAFDAPIFHPAPLTLAYSDHQLLQALIGAPVYALTGNLTVAYNLVLLLSIAASGAAMHVLARTVSGSTAAAFVAGLAWACWPYRTAHLIHLQLQALYFLPLAIWALLRVAAGRRWRDAGWVGIFAAAQAVSSVYYGVMTAVALAVSSMAIAWATGQWRAARYWSRVLGAAALAALLVTPVAWPYLRAQAIEGFGRNLFEAANHSASILSFTQVPPDNLLYGRSGILAPRDPQPGQRDRRHVEHQMFPGVVLLLCAGAGLAAGWRSDRYPIVLTSAALILSGVWLSLGPEGPGGLYRFLAVHAFGFDAIRAPARFAVVAMLGLTVLAALGVASARMSGWSARRGAAAWLPAAIGGLMLLEYVNAPLAFVPAPPGATAVGQWLRTAPEAGAVVYWPVALDRENTPYMVEALEHRRPIVNGYSGQRPGSYTAIAEALASLPGAEGLAMLRELDVRFVVAPAQWSAGGRPPFVERAVFGDRAIYEVRWTAAAEAMLEAAAAPPPPGPIPFSRTETATYAVRWIGDVPAGTITLTAGAPTAAEPGGGPGAVWRFEARAETAGWVSRFFEARDTFVTLAGADLVPRLHHREIIEGNRRIERAYLYDAASGRVLVGATVDEAQAPGAAALPLGNGARDALTAFFYVRTLEWAEGRRFTVPVNDAGRNLAVTVAIDGVESLATALGPATAFRARLQLERRLERREAVTASMWVTADARRLPVRLDLSAGFGQVRVELVDYRP